MTEKTSSVGDVDPQASGEVRGQENTFLRIAPGLSPVGFDIVIGSYDGSYSGSGPLHQYISRELGLKKVKEHVVLSGEGFRVLSIRARNSQTISLLVQVVSIYGGTDNAIELQASLTDLLHQLELLISNPIVEFGGGPKTMWIPTLGTGSAGLSQSESARLIAAALSNGLNITGGEMELAEIVIAPPENLSTEEYLAIETVFQATAFAKKNDAGLDGEASSSIDQKVEEPEADSEMPDQFHSDHALTDVKDDNLGRDAIAETIATNVIRLWKDQIGQQRPFAIHLSGRWGSGKSSILGFLEAKLSQEQTYHNEGWVVVNYNAWRMQDAGPPWGLGAASLAVAICLPA